MFAMMAEEEHKSDLMASEEEMAMAAQMKMLDEPPARASGGIGESPLKRQRLQLDEEPAQTEEVAAEEELATLMEEEAPATQVEEAPATQPEEELATQTEEVAPAEELATQMEEDAPATQVEEAPATQPEEELATQMEAQEAATADVSTEQTAESR